MTIPETAPRQTAFPETQTVIGEDTIPAVTILGVRFHCLLKRNVLDLLDQWIRVGQPRQVCFSNAYTVAFAQKDRELRNLLNHSDLVLADGMSIVWGARWIGTRIPERVAGPDLMEALCAHAEAKGYRIYLMGSSAENLEDLQSVLLSTWPRLNIVGLHSPPICDRMNNQETEIILTNLHETKPHILFVGMSAPKQERWIAENLFHCGVPVCLGVGAAFDFLSGRIPRAPQQIQDVGLEWVYRLYCEPRRLWKRYLLGNFIFLSLLLKQAFRKRFFPNPRQPIESRI